MKRTGLIASALSVLCVIGVAVHVVAQQQQPQRPQVGANGQPAGVDEPQPMFGPPPPQTRLEAIASQKGVLIIKGYTDVGEVQSDDGSRLRITAVNFTDARQSRETGVVVSIEQRGNEGAVIGYVDADELDPLAEALDALAKLEQATSPMANVEGVYRTRGDLEFTNHSNNGGRVVSVRATQILLPSGQVAQATASLRPARLAEIRQQLAAAKETLNRPKEQAGK
jgi:hypothetical protein